MRRGLILVLLLALPFSPLAAETLRFKYVKDEKYRLVTEVNEEVYVNGNLSHQANILNKVAVDTLAVRKETGLLSATFLTSERSYGVQTSFSLTEEYESLFWRDEIGRYDIGEAYFMPVVRNVPTFPVEDIEPGTSWGAAGEEAHDLRRSFAIEKPVRFPMTVSYTYVGSEMREGRKLEVIAIQYEVQHRLQGLASRTALVPVLIEGRSQQTYYWDNQLGKPYSYNEEFDFVFHLSDGQTVKYIGSAEGLLLESQELDREQVAEDIARKLEERGVEDTTVVAEEEGVTLNLQNIQFEPNSAALRESERAKLLKIGEILKDYPNRDILITGHTARVPGYTEQDHQLLSEQRATAVADYLLSLGALRPLQVTTRGMGHREPLSDNDTEAGRHQNRRVEITILEN
jgi:outer membrane protein OmpA-like peptidoglycan-associated protein